MSNSNKVVSIKVMTKSSYESERAEIETEYPKRGNFSAMKDQALSELFDRSGWTQKALSEIEGSGQACISQRLKFGAFLQFITSSDNSQKQPFQVPVNLTEYKFRTSFWSETKGNDRKRFLEVKHMIEKVSVLIDEHTIISPDQPTIKNSRQATRDIIEKFGDGKWHLLETISDFIESNQDTSVDSNDVLKKLSGMQKTNVQGCYYEKKKYGQSYQYKIIPGGSKDINMAVVTKEIQPILKELYAEGKKNMATMSPSVISHLANKLEKLLERLAK